MNNQHRIVITAAESKSRSEDSIGYIKTLTKSDKKEILEWMDYLPFTITSKASAQKARELKIKLEGFGFTLDINPKLNGLGQKKEKNLSGKPASWEFKTTKSFARKKNGSMGSIYIVIIIIILFFLLSAVSYYVIKSYVIPLRDNPSELIDKGMFNKAQKLISKDIDKNGPSAEKLFHRAQARILNIKKWGGSKNWKLHLTSKKWGTGKQNIFNYFHTKTGDSALADLKRAVKIEPKNAKYQKWLGFLYQERENWNKAKKAFKIALESDSKNVDLINFLALSHLHTGEPKKSTNLLTKALQIDPDNPMTLKNMGNIYLHHMKDSNRALRYYQSYIDLNKTKDFERPVIRKDITNILWNKYFPKDYSRRTDNIPFKLFEKRRIKLQGMLAKNKSAVAFKGLGDLFFDKGDFEEAKIFWFQSLKTNPKQTVVYQSLYRLQASLQDYSQAIGTIKNSIIHKCETPDMYFALGILEKYYSENEIDAEKRFDAYLNTGAEKFRGASEFELNKLKGM